MRMQGCGGCDDRVDRDFALSSSGKAIIVEPTADNFSHLLHRVTCKPTRII
jgi:hypothetical protein